MRDRYKIIGKPISKQPDWMPIINIENKPTSLRVRILKFDNPVFHEGLNFTVRLGDKWYNLLDTGGWFKPEGFDGYAKIRELQLRTFAQCKDRHILANEHDPDCHDYEGLRRDMGRAYPEFGAASRIEQDDAEVTVIGFVLYRPWN